MFRLAALLFFSALLRPATALKCPCDRSDARLAEDLNTRLSKQLKSALSDDFCNPDTLHCELTEDMLQDKPDKGIPACHYREYGGRIVQYCAIRQKHHLGCDTHTYGNIPDTSCFCDGQDYCRCAADNNKGEDVCDAAENGSGQEPSESPPPQGEPEPSGTDDPYKMDDYTEDPDREQDHTGGTSARSEPQSETTSGGAVTSAVRWIFLGAALLVLP